MNMERKMAKFVLSALVTAALVSAAMFPVPAAAVPGDAKDLRGGYWAERHRWIAFGRHDGKPIIWRILETGETDQGNPMAFLLAEDAVGENMEFDYSDDNDWDSSYIKRWLNDDFYYAAFSEKEQRAIVNRTYYYGGSRKRSDRKATSKVFLLSTDEAENKRFFANYADRVAEFENNTISWWLRSPGFSEDDAAIVGTGGGVIDIGLYVYHGGAVRPALKINLASSIFTSSSSKYEILYPVTVKVRDADTYLIRGAAVAADSPSQKGFTGNDGTAVMKLGTGKKKIRVSVKGRGVKELTLDVKTGGGGFTVDL
jgi:hypothetical protein